MGTECRPLQKHRRVDVVRRVALVPNLLPNAVEKSPAVRPLPLVVCIWKVGAEISERCSPEQSVGDGVQKHVGVRVAGQARVVRNLDPAQNERPIVDQPVNVVANTYPHGDSTGRWGEFYADSAGGAFIRSGLVLQAVQSCCASAQSSGVVILKLRR